MSDRDKTLDQEARGAAEGFADSVDAETGRTICKGSYMNGYLAAATARDKETEELRARVKELEGHLSKTQSALVHFTRIRGDRILDRDCNWLMLDSDIEDAIINAHNKEPND